MGKAPGQAAAHLILPVQKVDTGRIGGFLVHHSPQSRVTMLTDATHAVPETTVHWNDFYGAIKPKLTLADVVHRWRYVCRRIGAASRGRTRLAQAWWTQEDRYYRQYLHIARSAGSEPRGGASAVRAGT